MTSDWARLASLLAAGAVILLGARGQLREVRWGETAWRVMVALFVVTAVGAVILLARRDEPASPPPPSSAGELIA